MGLQTEFMECNKRLLQKIKYLLDRCFITGLTTDVDSVQIVMNDLNSTVRDLHSEIGEIDNAVDELQISVQGK